MPPSVPRLWPDSTVVILAGGPSLTQAQVDAVRGRAKVIAIKDAIRLAPWADAMYAADGKWWKHYGMTGFAGLRYAIEDPVDQVSAAKYGATVLRNTGEMGLETDPSGLRTGRNSGYQCIGLARHFGARRILLLGYDMQPTDGHEHWFREPRPRSYWTVPMPFGIFLCLFDTIVQPLKDEGIDVINCTPTTALECFRRMDLLDALEVACAATA